MTMSFRFRVFQILPDGTHNCWRTCRTFENAMREAKFTRREVEYAKRKGQELRPHFILDSETGVITEVKP